MKKKRSVCLLIAAILGVIYVIYIVSYFFGANASAGSTAEAIGTGIATAMVTPHLICIVLAVIFNVLGWFMNKRAFALTAGILYAVGAVMFLMYAPFVLVQMILAFVGFARLKTLTAETAGQ